jgi:adenylate cyclase
MPLRQPARRRTPKTRQGRARICRGCWEHLHLPIPLHGAPSLPFRAFGIRPSRMNPNTCTVCELMFTRVMKARNIAVDVSVLFADLRGYTALSRKLPPETCSSLLDAFYDEAAAAIWEHDGLLNKTIGDSVMAIFNFPLRHEDHPDRAILTARQIHRRCQERRQSLVGELPELTGTELGIGIGIDSGEVNFGEFGRSHRDLTAIGTVVNTASRAESVAAPGQTLVTRAVHDRSSGPEATASEYRLKGFDAPVPLYAV